MGRFFWGVFSRFLPPCQSKSVSCLFCCVFLFSWCLGEISPWQTSIGKAFTLAHLHWCLHWVTDFGYWAIRENVEETMTLSPTSSGLRHSTVLMFFFGMPMFWFLIFRGLIHVLWSCDIYVAQTFFFGNKMFEQYFAVQNIYLSQSVCSFKKEILCPSQQNFSKEGCCVLWKETYISL